jgi:hypothetical protein
VERFARLERPDCKDFFSMIKRKWSSEFTKGALFVLVLSLWLSGCSISSGSPDYSTPDRQDRSSAIPARSPAVSPYPTGNQGEGERPTSTPGPPSDQNRSVQPAKDFTPPPADQLALTTLAIRLGVPPGEINILSHGAWTNESPSCNLDMNEKQEALLFGSHMQVILSYKNRPYEYWVFQSGDVQFALPCQ